MKRAMVVILLASASAFAADKTDKKAKPPEAPAAAQATPKPPAELATEKWFEGMWSCEGTQHASPMGPEHKFKNKLGLWMDLAGWWLQFRIEQEVGPMKGEEVVEGFAGWDAAQKKHARYDFTPGGGTAVMTSSGWEGDKLVFAGDTMAMGKKIPVRHTFTKKGTNDFSTVLEMSGPDGKFMPLVEEACKKTGPAPKH